MVKTFRMSAFSKGGLFIQFNWKGELATKRGENKTKGELSQLKAYYVVVGKRQLRRKEMKHIFKSIFYFSSLIIFFNFLFPILSHALRTNPSLMAVHSSPFQ